MLTITKLLYCFCTLNLIFLFFELLFLEIYCSFVVYEFFSIVFHVVSVHGVIAIDQWWLTYGP